MSSVMTLQQASAFAALPLRALRREYPNHIMHVLNGPQDVGSPRQLHPVFFGCYDWHSAVHGFWLLARCAQDWPELPQQRDIQSLFADLFTTDNLQAERAYFDGPGRASFERPYGYAWTLALSQALADWRLPAAAHWRAALEPLVQDLRTRTLRYFSTMTYPIRVGTHYSSAFALLLALDFARHRGDTAFEAALVDAARRYYLADEAYPTRFEPGGDEFLSGALTEALLMSAVLASDQYPDWLERFLPDLEHAQRLLSPAEVSDRSDPKIAHLDGLNLSRAWCLRGIAQSLPPGHRWRDLLLMSAQAHTDASLPQVSNGHYEGEHWLATFGLLALAGRPV